MVRKEFNLEKSEKWVSTKLRMMLVRMDVGFDFLQIKTSNTPNIKKGQSILKETTNDLQRENSVKSSCRANKIALRKDQTMRKLKQAPQAEPSQKKKVSRRSP